MSFLPQAMHAEEVVIDDRARLAEDNESHYAFYVNFAPGRGKTVDINPPPVFAGPAIIRLLMVIRITSPDR
jgi:hypothetical protein